MIAAYPGKCAGCQDPITVGQTIEQRQGGRWWHVRCADLDRGAHSRT